MKTVFQIFLLLFLWLPSKAQVVVSGNVRDESGEGLIGTNVYLLDTYDGGTTDISGNFSFETFESGDQTLIVSFIGYRTVSQAINLSESREFHIQLEPAFNTMQAVTISAGSFEASDEKKAVLLNSLDIAMTAGALADIPSALSTLPGTQKNPESGRLFVRGGAANETKVFIDGIEAANFYGTSGPSIPTRGRFSPFLFKGTFFSTGGYSAEYGQALSAAIVLKTKDIEPESRVDFSLMSVGLDASVIQSSDDQSSFFKLGYVNLNPYNKLIAQRVDWEEGAVSKDVTYSFKKDFENGGKFRSLAMASTNGFKLNQETILNESGLNQIAVRNDYLFASTSYELPVGTDDIFYAGASFTFNYDHASIDQFKSTSPISNYHLKTKYNHRMGERTFLNVGAELYLKDYAEKMYDSIANIHLSFNQVRPVVFAELDHYLSENWVMRGGLRIEYEDHLNTLNLNPRLSLAYKINEFEQVSLAIGQFNQDPDNAFLRFSNELKQEKANHYLFNYQRSKDLRTFRIEGYLKTYDQLVNFENAFDPTTFSNDGNGYAYGLDLFWRDRETFKDLDYWVSYSWLDSKRRFRDYTELSKPEFISAHNFSIVTKKWISRFKSQIGVTYSYTSGRPYDHPGKEGFNESLTKGFHDLSYNMAWLPIKNLIIYVSASNLLGQDQVFGHRFAESPDVQGDFISEPTRLPAKRFIFLGCFITLGSNKNQLDNL